MAQGCHVILAGGGVNFAAATAQHLDNSFFKPVKIQINVNLQRLIGFCAGPVAFEFPPPHHIHHRLGIVNMQAVQYIPVIPFLEFGKINVILAAQPLDLILSKTRSAGSIMEYSSKMLIAECSPYFLMGRIPVM